MNRTDVITSEYVQQSMRAVRKVGKLIGKLQATNQRSRLESRFSELCECFAALIEHIEEAQQEREEEIRRAASVESALLDSLRTIRAASGVAREKHVEVLFRAFAAELLGENRTC